MRERREMTPFCSCLLHFLSSRPWLWVSQHKPVNRAGPIMVKVWGLVSDFLHFRIQSVTFHLCVEWLSLSLGFPSLKWRKLIPATEGFAENYRKSCMWVPGTCLMPSKGQLLSLIPYVSCRWGKQVLKNSLGDLITLNNTVFLEKGILSLSNQWMRFLSKLKATKERSNIDPNF